MTTTSDLDRVSAHLDALPVFPLPNGVLLPFEMLPLHIFEPRYRQMISDVVESGRPLAIAQLAPGWEGDYEGRPPIEPVCGVGLVVRHEPLPDGRSNILLRGVARMRVESELPPRRLYREVRARLLEDRSSRLTEETLVDNVESLRRMLFSLCASRPVPAATALAQLAARTAAPGALADIVIAAVVSDVARRQQALQQLDPADRLELAQNALAELLVGTAPTEEPRFRN